MSAAPINRIKILAIGGLLALAAIFTIWLTSRPEDTGSLSLSVTLPDGKGVVEIAYRVTADGLPVIEREAWVADPQSPTSVMVDDLPPGSGYRVEVTAQSPDSVVRCSRKSSFDVAAGQATHLDLAIPCRDLTSISRFVAARKAGMKELVAAASVGTPAPTVEVPPECSSCEQENVANGNCEPDSGCDGLTGEDQQLCQNLLNCMRATNCWVKDPLDCLCGTVDYVECTKHANGVCRAEMQAATRTTDPIKNGTLFYDPTVPAGRANRLISCDKEKCMQHCSLE